MTARILVVDDVDANVRLLEAKLTSEYYDVISCVDGATALTMAAEEQPDIIEGSSPWTSGWFAASSAGHAKKVFIYHQDPVAVYPHTLFDRYVAARQPNGHLFERYAPQPRRRDGEDLDVGSVALCCALDVFADRVAQEQLGAGESAEDQRENRREEDGQRDVAATRLH